MPNDKPTMQDNNPTSNKRLTELVNKFEVATTNGEITLTGDDIGDVYSWLLWSKGTFPSE